MTAFCQFEKTFLLYADNQTTTMPSLIVGKLINRFSYFLIYTPTLNFCQTGFCKSQISFQEILWIRFKFQNWNGAFPKVLVHLIAKKDIKDRIKNLIFVIWNEEIFTNSYKDMWAPMLMGLPSSQPEVSIMQSSNCTWVHSFHYLTIKFLSTFVDTYIRRRPGNWAME